MEILIFALLGLVQGLCEFLPISSSGHLVLLSSLFGVEDSLLVSIILHLATLLAVVIVFRKEILFLIKHPLSEESVKLALATIPTCIIVLILMPLVEKAFGGGGLAICFLITALLLFISQKYNKKGQGFSTKTALIMGISQGFAVFPGISRSGATISAGILSGADRRECAKFSFLMSVPIILLSLVMEVYEVSCGVQLQINWLGLIIGFVIAFVVGIMTIKLMLNVTGKANFKWFCLYLIFISLVSAIL